MSEYFAYMFILYEVVLLFFIVRVLGKGRHVLLWVPVLTFGLISIALLLISRSDMHHAIYFKSFVAERWVSHIVIKLACCLVASALSWLLCGIRKDKQLTWRAASVTLTLIFAVGLIFSGAARYFNFPYNLSSEKGDCFWLREWYPGKVYYDYPLYHTFEGRIDITTQAKLSIYEKPDSDSAIVGSIPANLDVSFYDTWLSKPTENKNWRYVRFGAASPFPMVNNLSGYIKTSDAIKSFAFGQKTWLLDWTARANLFMQDHSLYAEGTLTPEYARSFYPFGIQLSAALLLLSAAAYGFLSVKKSKLT